MDGDFEHCRRLVARVDNDRYLATLFAPAQHRQALFALYAFNVEITGVADHVREPAPGEIRLQWWREAISGARDPEAAAHPVAAALREAMHDYAIAATPLIALIDAHAFDLYREPMASVTALEDYVRASEGNLLTLAATILGVRSDAADALCERAGLAAGFAAVLHRFAHDAASGRVFLPSDILAHHHAAQGDILSGQSTPELRAALAEMRLRTRHYLDAAQASSNAVPPQFFPALLPLALVRPRLARMERGDGDPFRPCDFAKPKRQWLLWRAAHNPRRIFG